ncbi:MAG: phosphatidate cytidylyltransferase [Flavobacteriales bacterium]|nr:phosphatidate cytidylyltransferase [Flavobacteriales bacterium]MDG1780060.1 phosphatidate cytidylyltransferase [Flavobacteriales bacterium]MDG2246602.1 phosphatidate cytidylyltransferase [Flavobacteriales bacterium]
MVHLIVVVLVVIGGVANYLIGRKLNDKASIRANKLKFRTYVLLLVIHLVIMEYSSLGYWLFSALIVFIGLIEILMVSKRRITSFRTRSFSLLIAGLIAFFYLLFVNRFQTEVVLVNFIIVIAFDAFSQLGGKFLGKTKITNISPNKTWEGLIVGLMTSVFLAVLLCETTNVTANKWVSCAIGLVIGISCFFGDLLASKFKRIAGVKDFSNLLPGQGGILDRYDSLLATGLSWVIISSLLPLGL